ncbi:MAG: GNAT family N-acetyltransferase [Usitatibacter sp.]
MTAAEIAIRRAEPDDHEALWRIYQETRAYAGTLQLPYPSREMWRKRLLELPESDYLLVACADGQIVGSSGLHASGKSPRRAHAMMLGLGVAEAWHGKGVGSRLVAAMTGLADDWLNVIRLELTVFTDNERAIALYRKFGFEIEGTHRAYALRAGEYVDSHSMARLRPKRAPATGS